MKCKKGRRFSGAERAIHRKIEALLSEFIKLAIINPILNRELGTAFPVL